MRTVVALDDPLFVCLTDDTDCTVYVLVPSETVGGVVDRPFVNVVTSSVCDPLVSNMTSATIEPDESVITTSPSIVTPAALEATSRGASAKDAAVA